MVFLLLNLRRPKRSASVALQKEVHAQHARPADRRAADIATLRVVRLDRRFKPRPRHQRVDATEEPFTPRLPLLASALGTGKIRLR